MRIRSTRGRRVRELQQVDPGRVRRVAEAQMHSLQISRLHSERLGHFLAGHARSEVEDDLEAEQLVERQRALQVRTVDVEVEDPLNHGLSAPQIRPGRPRYHCSSTAVRPPSTNSWVPVTKEASSLARKAAALPMSVGVPIRFST